MKCTSWPTATKKRKNTLQSTTLLLWSSPPYLACVTNYTCSVHKQSYQNFFADRTKMKFFTGSKFRKEKCTKDCTINCASALKTTLNIKVNWRFYRKILVLKCSNYQFFGWKRKIWTIFMLFLSFWSLISLYFVKTLNALKFALIFLVHWDFEIALNQLKLH